MCAQIHPRLPKLYSASRELRNQAEKQRRDKLNYQVSELAALVPFVSNSQKKVDKTSILRLAASYIRMYQFLQNNSSKKWAHLSSINAQASKALLNIIGGFYLVITSSGKIVYASEAIDDTFGYTQADVLGQSFYSFIPEEDVEIVKQNLLVQENHRRSFRCRMFRKSLSRNDASRYEIIHVVGQLKPIPEVSFPNKKKKIPTRISLRRRTSASRDKSKDNDPDEEDYEDLPSPSEFHFEDIGSHMLVARVQVDRDRPITDISWVESTRDEYITRHRADGGTIVHTDHRISYVIGMMPEEVFGESAFAFMHPDNLLWSILAQLRMFETSDGQGTVTYRLRCKNNTYQPLRSRGFIENKATFVCVNTALSDAEADKEIEKQKNELLAVLEVSPPGEMQAKLKMIGLPNDVLQPILAELGQVMSSRQHPKMDDSPSEASPGVIIEEVKSDDDLQTDQQVPHNKSSRRKKIEGSPLDFKKEEKRKYRRCSPPKCDRPPFFFSREWDPVSENSSLRNGERAPHCQYEVPNQAAPNESVISPLMSMQPSINTNGFHPPDLSIHNTQFQQNSIPGHGKLPCTEISHQYCPSISPSTICTSADIYSSYSPTSYSFEGHPTLDSTAVLYAQSQQDMFPLQTNSKHATNGTYGPSEMYPASYPTRNGYDPSSYKLGEFSSLNCAFFPYIYNSPRIQTSEHSNRKRRHL